MYTSAPGPTCHLDESTRKILGPLSKVTGHLEEEILTSNILNQSFTLCKVFYRITPVVRPRSSCLSQLCQPSVSEMENSVPASLRSTESALLAA